MRTKICFMVFGYLVSWLRKNFQRFGNILKAFGRTLYTLMSMSFRYILPALPDEGFVVLSQEKANNTVEHHINSSSVLHPLILPRLYPPLFTLYALHTEKADAVYTERLHQLNKRGDVALMSFLGVNRYLSICCYPTVHLVDILLALCSCLPLSMSLFSQDGRKEI